MGTIVVGVDGSKSSQEALRFALDEARLRGASVKAIFAWVLPFAGNASMGLIPSVLAAFRAEAEQLLGEAVTETGGASDVSIERIVVEGPAGKSLIEAAKGAELLVVGSRGRGGFTGLLLGSVCQQ